MSILSEKESLELFNSLTDALQIGKCRKMENYDEVSKQVDNYNKKYGHDPKYIIISNSKLKKINLELENCVNNISKVELMGWSRGIPLIIKEECIEIKGGDNMKIGGITKEEKIGRIIKKDKKEKSKKDRKNIELTRE